MSRLDSSAVGGRRVCALLAAGSAALHAVMAGDARSAVTTAVVIAMALACLYCARELWTAGSPRVWCVVAVMNLGMVAVHLSMPGHHHGQVVSTTPAATTSPLMAVATSLAIVEAAVAAVVLWVQTRSRASNLALAARSRGAI
ncbi:hypothetical protein H7K45_01350 [Mycobacterium yunnanensis]|uniref:Uncharacterized protein n=1 Tax=Mycobacterium yunnanensis TaxID=368477 RepID=A0A9X2YWN2_9MYCO|nr:hypothetical protein [Mycobacterium yunnanensis]MCV7419176.1 hypothetical protein [Mycobacterium yunnanensis]